jgi:hypothetical protein
VTFGVSKTSKVFLFLTPTHDLVTILSSLSFIRGRGGHMTGPTSFSYDVFISYSHADRAWVHGWLLPKLESAGLRVCIDTCDFDIGVPGLVNMERAVDNSRHTLLVLTPDWVVSEWTDFEALLTQTTDPAGRRRKLLPLLLEPCKPPARIGTLTYADFADPAHRDVQVERVVAAAQGRLRLQEIGPALDLLPGSETPSAEATADDPPPVIQTPNPFCDRGRISDPARFFNRRRLVRELQQILSAGNSVSLVGERQIGKSSLIYYLFATRKAWLPESTVLYLDMQGVLDEADFCAEVLEGLCESPGDLRTLKRTLRRRQVVLLLDEVEKLRNPDFSPRLHDLLRAFAQEPGLKLAVTSLRPLKEIFPPAESESPFHNIFTERRVGPFAPQEARDLLQARLIGSDAVFTEAEIFDIVASSGGHPARLQELACALFDLKREG